MYTKDFMEYLQKERKMSKNTLEAYNRDVLEFMAFEGSRGMTDILNTSSTEIVAFAQSQDIREIRGDGEQEAGISEGVFQLSHRSRADKSQSDG